MRSMLEVYIVFVSGILFTLGGSSALNIRFRYDDLNEIFLIGVSFVIFLVFMYIAGRRSWLEHKDSAGES